MLSRGIEYAIQQGDYFRRPPLHLRGRGNFKEWVHFCCITDEIELLINFSISTVDGRDTPRLLCAVRTAGWDGDIDTFSMSETQVFAGGTDVRMGASQACYAEGKYMLTGRLRNRPIGFQLVLVPTAVPSQLSNVKTDVRTRLHWFLVPSLRATGFVEVAGRWFELRDAPSYHDRNWGTFRWGRSTCWIWGYGKGQSGGDDYCLTFDRLTDSGRLYDRMRSVILWRNGQQHRVFHCDEVTLVERGQFRVAKPFRLPRVASLLRPDELAEVPTEAVIEARQDNDFVRLVFRAADLFQILVPNDDDLEFTVINEVSGQLSVEGLVRGQSFSFETRTIFEFLHG
jgi:hypothetical protein